MTHRPALSRLVSETRQIHLHRDNHLLFRAVDHNDIVGVCLAFNSGSWNEPWDQAGLHTLALRMLTRGTSQLSALEIASKIETLGSSISTDVRRDQSVIRVRCLREHFNETMDLLGTLMKDSVFAEEEFDVEQVLLLKEIREDEDQPFHTATRLFMETALAEHPYGHSPDGTEATVGHLTCPQVARHYRETILKSPVSIAVVGNLTEKVVLQAIDHLFQHLDIDHCKHPHSTVPKLAPSSEKKLVSDQRNTDAECIVYGYPVPGLNTTSFAAWKIIDSVLGGSMDSRLFAEIREKEGLVYQIGSAYPSWTRQSVLALQLVTTVSNHDRVLELLDREVDRLKTTLVDQSELDRAVTYLDGTFLMSLERNLDQAMFMARYQGIGAGMEFATGYPAMLRSVTLEEIREVASRYLTVPVISVVGPPQENSPQPPDFKE